MVLAMFKNLSQNNALNRTKSGDGLISFQILKPSQVYFMVGISSTGLLFKACMSEHDRLLNNTIVCNANKTLHACYTIIFQI